MNHVISILLISLFAAFLSACDDENTSVSAAPVPASSASVPASSASVVHSSPLYIAEIGYVCNGFPHTRGKFTQSQAAFESDGICPAIETIEIDAIQNI